MSEPTRDGEPSNTSDEVEGVGAISDDQLPEDLQPTDENPLAQPRDDEAKDSGMSLGPDGPRG